MVGFAAIPCLRGEGIPAFWQGCSTT